MDIARFNFVPYFILVLYIALPPSEGTRLNNAGPAMVTENNTATAESITPAPTATTPSKEDNGESLQPTQSRNSSAENYTYLITGDYRPTNYTSSEFLVSVSTGDLFSYFDKRHSSYCAGAIIHPKVVLTAAHCLKHTRLTSFFSPHASIVARHGAKRSGVTPIPHPNFHRYSHQRDIAVILLDQPMEPSDRVRPIPLPRTQPEPGEVCTVVGWSTKSNEPDVYFVDVKILPDTLCAESSVICVVSVQPNPENTCWDGSGDLLVCSGTIAGIKTHNRDCGNPISYAIYTDVYKVIGWISLYENPAARREPAAVVLYVMASLVVWCVVL